MGFAVDRAAFAETMKAKFKAAPNATQSRGYNALFRYWETSTLNDPRWLAYVLATVYHETGGRIEAVREGFCADDDCSIRAVTRLFDRGKIKRNYALPHANGHSYFGRGLVQITHGYNYERLGKALGMGRQLYDNPSLALELDISVKITFVGMVEGLFTAKRLADYFNDRKTEWRRARQIVNALDCAGDIAAHGRKFLACVTDD